MTRIPEVYEQCKEVLKSKKYYFHDLGINVGAFANKAPMRCCIYKYNQRTKKTKVIYFSSQFIMVVYTIKKKLFTSTLDFSNRNYDKKQVHIKYFNEKDIRIDKL